MWLAVTNALAYNIVELICTVIRFVALANAVKLSLILCTNKLVCLFRACLMSITKAKAYEFKLLALQLVQW